MIDERPIFFVVIVDKGATSPDDMNLRVVMSHTREDAISLAKLKTVDGTAGVLIYRGVEVGAFQDGLEVKEEAVRGS